MSRGREARSAPRTGGGARHQARELAFRIAYQADLTGDSCAAVWRAQDTAGWSEDQRALVEDVVGALDRAAEFIDTRLREAAEHWPLERLSATDRAALRTAVAELIARPGSPARVVLDEAIEIAKRYGSEESGRFVNGVLDHVARALRPAELA